MTETRSVRPLLLSPPTKGPARLVWCSAELFACEQVGIGHFHADELSEGEKWVFRWAAWQLANAT